MHLRRHIHRCVRLALFNIYFYYRNIDIVRLFNALHFVVVVINQKIWAHVLRAFNSAQVTWGYLPHTQSIVAALVTGTNLLSASENKNNSETFWCQVLIIFQHYLYQRKVAGFHCYNSYNECPSCVKLKRFSDKVLRLNKIHSYIFQYFIRIEFFTFKT